MTPGHMFIHTSCGSTQTDTAENVRAFPACGEGFFTATWKESRESLPHFSGEGGIAHEVLREKENVCCAMTEGVGNKKINCLFEKPIAGAWMEMSCR